MQQMAMYAYNILLISPLSVLPVLQCHQTALPLLTNPRISCCSEQNEFLHTFEHRR